MGAMKPRQLADSAAAAETAEAVDPSSLPILLCRPALEPPTPPALPLLANPSPPPAVASDAPPAELSAGEGRCAACCGSATRTTGG